MICLFNSKAAGPHEAMYGSVAWIVPILEMQDFEMGAMFGWDF